MSECLDEFVPLVERSSNKAISFLKFAAHNYCSCQRQYEMSMGTEDKNCFVCKSIKQNVSCT